jgi:hypothetical protein
VAPFGKEVTCGGTTGVGGLYDILAIRHIVYGLVVPYYVLERRVVVGHYNLIVYVKLLGLSG